MARALDLLAQDALTFTPQAETGVIYAEKISKAEALIDWSRDADDSAQSGARAVALSRRRFSCRSRQGRLSGSRFCAAERHRCPGRARHRSRRRTDHRLRPRRAAAFGGATRRQGADAGRRFSARRAAYARHAARRFSQRWTFTLSARTFCLFNRIGSIRKPLRTFRSDALMPRYKLTIEYDGAGLVGWQRQANGPSVQEAIETALTAITGTQGADPRRRTHRRRRPCARPGRACRSRARLAA